jgi:hypothetical protein
MNVHTGELSHGGPYNRNMSMTNRELLKKTIIYTLILYDKQASSHMGGPTTGICP